MRTIALILAALALVTWAGCRANRQEPEDAAGLQQDIEDNDNSPADQNDNAAAPENQNAETLENANVAVVGGTTAEQGVARLTRFESEVQLETYFKEQILSHNDSFGGIWAVEDSEDFDVVQEGLAEEAPAPPPAPEVGAGDEGGQVTDRVDEESFSATTIQEEGVDEADVVKTDGTYIYIVTDDWDSGQANLHIVRAVPPGEMQLVGTFPLRGRGSELYLVGDVAVSLTTRTEYPESDFEDLAAFFIDFFLESLDGTIPGGEEGDNIDPVAEFLDLLAGTVPRNETIVTLVDVSDRSAPALLSQTALLGSIASSRMIDGVLRLVIANHPDDFYGVLPLGIPQIGELLNLVDLDALLPDFETTDAAGNVTGGNIVEWDDFFRPADPDGFGVTTVITLDTTTPDQFDAVAIMAEPGLVYASTEALYFTDTDRYFDFRRVDTDIYKFAFEEGTVSLVGAGTVPGRVLNQYSMGEYQGYLRVATTTDQLFFWETGDLLPSRNSVFVLGEDEGELVIVGSIEDLGIGEQIQSARFIGSRGYLVTFEQTDPLFTLDLSDPTDPRAVGELEIPGFSTFIVPLDQDHLLTVGVYVDPEGWGGWEGVQLSIFDVSDFAQPERTYNVVIGNSGTSSEATWNPKAFTYFAAGDLLALPIEHYGWFGSNGWVEDDWWFETGGVAGTDGLAEEGLPEGDGGTAEGSGGEATEGAPRQTPTPPPDEIGEFRGLFVYRVTAADGFDYLGRVSTDLSGQGFWYGWPLFTRGVFVEDHVYAVTDRVVVAAPVADLASVTASAELPDQYADAEEPVTPDDTVTSPVAEPEPASGSESADQEPE